MKLIIDNILIYLHEMMDMKIINFILFFYYLFLISIHIILILLSLEIIVFICVQLKIIDGYLREEGND